MKLDLFKFIAVPLLSNHTFISLIENLTKLN